MDTFFLFFAVPANWVNITLPDIHLPVPDVHQENAVPVIILDIHDRMTIRYWDALSFQSKEDVRQQVDTLVFKRPDDGLEIHLVDGQFVFNNGDLVFDDHEDEAPADVVDGLFNNLDLVFDNDEDDAPVAAAAEVDTGTSSEHRTEVLYDTEHARDIPLGFHAFNEFKRAVTKLTGCPR